MQHSSALFVFPVHIHPMWNLSREPAHRAHLHPSFTTDLQVKTPAQVHRQHNTACLRLDNKPTWRSAAQQGNGFPPRVASLHIRREMCPLGVSVQLKPVNVMSFWHFAWWGESSVRWTVLSLKASHDAWWSIDCSITVIFAQHVPCF